MLEQIVLQCVVSLAGSVALPNIDVIYLWIKQRLVHQRVGTVVRAGALNAGVEVRFVYGIVLALVDVDAFALWANILDCLRMFQEYLDVTPGQAVMVIEEVIYAMPFLECVRGAFPRFLHSLYVASIVVVVHITQSLTTM